MTDYTPMSFKLNNEIAAALKETAAREERSQTAIVERALRAYIAASKAAEPTQTAPAETAVIAGA